MSIKIEHKVSHREWDEAQLTPEQFIKFDDLYHSKSDGDDGLNERCNLIPTFAFDKGTVYVDENWGIDDDGHVSASSFRYGVMIFSGNKGQYIKSVDGREKELGQLVAVGFTVDDAMLEVFNRISDSLPFWK